MSVDEFYYHHKRGLPRWERIGHPVDSFFFLLPLCVALFFSPTKENQNLFIILSVLSCLVVTKDEFVHKELCVATEQWLHALLFILHPIVLFSFYQLWIMHELFLLSGLSLVSLLFFFYQIIYWNIFYEPLKNR